MNITAGTCLFCLVPLFVFFSCTGIFHAPRYAENRRIEMRGIQRQIDAAIRGEETQIDPTVRVMTDSTEVDFLPELCSVRLVGGLLFLHGTARAPDGATLTYVAIRFEHLRELEIDWPLEVVYDDSLVVVAPGGTWSAGYNGGRLTGFVLRNTPMGNDGPVTVAMSRVNRFRPVPKPLFWYEFLDVLDVFGGCLH